MSQGKDLRGFVYQLAPVMKVAEWELNRRQQKMATIQVEYSQGEIGLHAMKRSYAEESDNAKKMWTSQLNLANHRHALRYLELKRIQIQVKHEELLRLRASLEEARKACIEQQMKLELVESHRENAVFEYSMERSNILSAEADSDWNARSIWRKKMNMERI